MHKINSGKANSMRVQAHKFQGLFLQAGCSQETLRQDWLKHKSEYEGPSGQKHILRCLIPQPPDQSINPQTNPQTYQTPTLHSLLSLQEELHNELSVYPFQHPNFQSTVKSTISKQPQKITQSPPLMGDWGGMRREDEEESYGEGSKEGKVTASTGRETTRPSSGPIDSVIFAGEDIEDRELPVEEGFIEGRVAKKVKDNYREEFLSRNAIYGHGNERRSWKEDGSEREDLYGQKESLDPYVTDPSVLPHIKARFFRSSYVSMESILANKENQLKDLHITSEHLRKEYNRLRFVNKDRPDIPQEARQKATFGIDYRGVLILFVVAFIIGRIMGGL